MATRQYESLRKAVEAVAIDWDNIVVFANRYDPTTNATICGMWAQGNTYAIEGQVVEWVDDLQDGPMGCSPGCDCSSGDGPDDESADRHEDDEFNR